MGRHSCCYKQKLRKGLWSPEEDEKLLRHITKYGHGCWSSVPKQAGKLSNSISISIYNHKVEIVINLIVFFHVAYYQVCKDVVRVAGLGGSIT